MLDILIRVHEDAYIDLLTTAINSIRAQSYKEYNVVILGQNLSQEKLTEVKKITELCLNLEIKNLAVPPGDHRSFLLNHGLATSKAKFLAVLDYDDLAYQNSYELLINDLTCTESDISFGGVKKVIFDSETNKTLSVAENAFYGPGTYYHYLNRPFLPIHSYVLNLENLKKKKIPIPKFPEEICYLEDSCFLAQLLPLVKSSFNFYNQNLFEYRLRLQGDSYSLTQTRLQKENWNKSQDYFYNLARSLKSQYRDFTFYKNTNFVIRLKSHLIGLLNRNIWLRPIRDQLKKLN